MCLAKAEARPVAGPLLTAAAIRLVEIAANLSVRSVRWRVA